MEKKNQRFKGKQIRDVQTFYYLYDSTQKQHLKFMLEEITGRVTFPTGATALGGIHWEGCQWTKSHPLRTPVLE